MLSLRRGSHRRIRVTCELGMSPRCRREWSIEERLANETRARNEGRMICLFCSRASKSAGRRNPNTRYRDLDDCRFEEIDTEAKAYALGWIASDGSVRANSITIYIDQRDAATLHALRDIVCPSLPIKSKRNRKLVGFAIHSQRIVGDICRYLDIVPGKKDAAVGFPHLATEELTWAFVRGFFDGDGSIGSIDASVRRASAGWPSPRCSIASTSDRLLDGIARFAGIPCHRGKGVLEWNGTNALDFLGRVYKNATCSLTRKRDLYQDWCNWLPSLVGPTRHGKHPLFRWTKVHAAAVAPSKEFVSDSGFDITLIEVMKRHGAVEFFRTGIRVQPAFGWYFDLVPRSSISKTGYMLANGIGVIDQAYVGEIIVPLIKIDQTAPELELPARLVQIIPRPIVAVEMVEVDELDPTARGGGGFGSTGK